MESLLYRENELMSSLTYGSNDANHDASNDGDENAEELVESDGSESSEAHADVWPWAEL